MVNNVSELLVTRFIANIGTVDGILETVSVRNYNVNNLEIDLFAKTSSFIYI